MIARDTWRKFIVVAVIALVASQYLAGFGFLWWIHAPIAEASPLTVARYAYYYGDDPDLARGLWLFSVGAFGVLGAMSLIAFWPPPRALHGDARFETHADIERAGLLGPEGIILGQWGHRYLMLPGQQGVALAAPPRAGKGTGIVIPNALNWSGSLVCLDLKRENWVASAGYRQEGGQKCFLFEPFAEDGRTSRWNPFFYVAADPARRINDLQRIASMLFPDPPGDTFWMASARSLFFGIALYLFETPGLPHTIGEVLRQGMASDEEDMSEHWQRVIAERRDGDRPLSDECVRAIYDAFRLPPQTAGSIRKTFTSRLDLWLNPILDAATSENDFDLRELRKTPMSIYVGVNPEDLHRLRPVLNLFFQQAIGLQTRELPEHNPALKYQVMMLLDEFTALGRIPIIAEAISYLPGYNVRVVLVIQTPAQLREVYGLHNADTMLKSLAARIVFTPKDHADAVDISNELGNETVRVKSISTPRWRLGGGDSPRGASISVSEQRRPLLLPQEVKALPAREALVFYEGLRPIRCAKIQYFKDPILKKRVRVPPARPPAVTMIRRTPHRAAGPAPGTRAANAPLRAATVADLKHLDRMRADEVLLDLKRPLFADVAAGAPAADRDIAHWVDEFMNALPQPQPG